MKVKLTMFQYYALVTRQFFIWEMHDKVRNLGYYPNGFEFDEINAIANQAFNRMIFPDEWV